MCDNCGRTGASCRSAHASTFMLSTPMPAYRFPGLVPGDRWCVTALNWLRAHQDGRACPVVLASTHERTLDAVPLDVLKRYAVDVPDDPAGL